MRRAWPAYRSVSALAISIATLAALAASCGSADPPEPLPRDLVRDVASARMQPAASADVARLGEITSEGASTPALLLTAPARLTWSVRFAERADLEASVALLASNPPAATPLGVTLRIGISDNRSYDELARVPLTAEGRAMDAWQPLRIDLSAYSGWKWSLFYQPSRLTWNLIVAADPTPGGTVACRTLVLRPHNAAPSR